MLTLVTRPPHWPLPSRLLTTSALAVPIDGHASLKALKVTDLVYELAVLRTAPS